MVVSSWTNSIQEMVQVLGTWENEQKHGKMEDWGVGSRKPWDWELESERGGSKDGQDKKERTQNLEQDEDNRQKESEMQQRTEDKKRANKEVHGQNRK